MDRFAITEPMLGIRTPWPSLALLPSEITAALPAEAPPYGMQIQSILRAVQLPSISMCNTLALVASAFSWLTGTSTVSDTTEASR